MVYKVLRNRYLVLTSVIHLDLLGLKSNFDHMNQKNYNWMLYIITVVIIGVISIQFYWNYENYKNQESILINEVQTSLDKAVEDYYEELARENTLNSSVSFDSNSTGNIEHVFKALNIEQSTISYSEDKLPDGFNSNVSVGLLLDSLPKKGGQIIKMDSNGMAGILGELVMKVITSLEDEKLNIGTIESNFKERISSKSIELNCKINLFKKGEPKNISLSHELKSKSTLLPPKSEVVLEFDSPSWQILGRIKFGIVLSLTLILGVLFCLYYLLFTIEKQKKISQMKNDLIGNITHEFKTPIATISVALEALREKYNSDEKSHKYFDISENQLEKLNIMVEKLLETATLGKGSFKFSHSTFNLNHTLTNLYDKSSMICTDEFISLNLEKENLTIYGDAVHIENAIENIIDNALKYGGQRIVISSKKEKKCITIQIEDDGNVLSSEDKELVFKSFYRKSVGNTHDVKGYGIGLYYSKSIIEAHHGTIELEVNPTRFIITLPYDEE